MKIWPLLIMMVIWLIPNQILTQWSNRTMYLQGLTRQAQIIDISGLCAGMYLLSYNTRVMTLSRKLLMQ